MIEEQELIELQAAINASEEAPQQPSPGKRAMLTLAARQRASSADLLKAHLALMEKEVILPRQNDLFRLIKYHYYTLQFWHDQHTGWRIQRSNSAIRLIRYPSTTTPGYIYDRLKEPGDFACLTWILWYAENRQLSGRGNDQQFLLSQLAEQIQEQAAANPENERKLDFRRPTDRFSIQRALQYLEDLGGLQLVDGQTREWVEQAPGADVLYEFTDVIRSLVTALNPQLVASVAERLHDGATMLQSALLPNASDTAPLTRAWRALLLGPALFRFDDAAAFAELQMHADAIANELLETFGWLLDIQRDYACIVRASGSSTGPICGLLPYATNDQIAILICTAIRQRVKAKSWPAPDPYGCLHITIEDMTDLFYTVRERYGENWGNEARHKSSRSLLHDVYRKMRQVGLMRGPDEAGAMLILPTAARYTATYDKPGQEQEPPAPTQSKTKTGLPATVPSKTKTTQPPSDHSKAGIKNDNKPNRSNPALAKHNKA